MSGRQKRKRKRKDAQQEAAQIAATAREQAVDPGPSPVTAQARQMTRAELAREKTQGRVAGSIAFLSFLLTVAALSVSSRAATSVNPDDVTDRDTLIDLADPDKLQLLGAILRVLSLLVLIGFALFLYRAIRSRNPEHRSWIPALGIVALVLLAATTLASYAEVHSVAKDFVGSGPRTEDRAQDLLDRADDGALLRIVDIVIIGCTLLFGLWVSLSSYEGMRIGLLTRFLGIFGIGAGVTGVANIAQVSQALFLGWSVSVGLLALGYWPGGRPPAWTEGRAVAWDDVDEKTMTIRPGR